MVKGCLKLKILSWYLLVQSIKRWWLVNINYIIFYIKLKFCGRAICTITVPFIESRFNFQCRIVTIFLVTIHSLVGLYLLQLFKLRMKSIGCLTKTAEEDLANQISLESTQVRTLLLKCDACGILPTSPRASIVIPVCISIKTKLFPLMISPWWPFPCITWTSYSIYLYYLFDAIYSSHSNF